MAVYKRGDTYWFEYNFQGKRHRVSTGTGDPKAARNIAAKYRADLAEGAVGLKKRDPAPTLKDFAPRFNEAIKMQCAEKPRTVRFYLDRVEQLLKNAALAKTRLDDIDEAKIEAYKQSRSKAKSRRDKPLSPGSINRELATLRRLLRLAMEWKVIQRVPRVRLLKGERHREFVFSNAQESLYLSAATPLLQDVATVLLDTGLRAGELISLEWPQVRLEPAQGARYGYLTILSGKAKSSKSRNMPLSARVVEILKKWGPKPEGFVFHRADGQSLSLTYLDQQHAALRHLFKLPSDCVLHSMRHTFGTRLGESGADAFTIMRLMGHSTATVSMRYVHPSPEATERAFERFCMLNEVGSLPKVPTVDGPERQAIQ